jgi:hypothetical protein
MDNTSSDRIEHQMHPPAGVSYCIQYKASGGLIVFVGIKIYLTEADNLTRSESSFLYACNYCLKVKLLEKIQASTQFLLILPGQATIALTNVHLHINQI